MFTDIDFLQNCYGMFGNNVIELISVKSYTIGEQKMMDLPIDSNGRYYIYNIDDSIPPKEISKICHEINYYYHSKYEGLPIIAHRSIGLDNCYYIYYCENHGFGEYNIFMRLEDLDEEDD